MKVKCNGKNKHINEITEDELEKKLQPIVVLRGGPSASKREIPPRLVLPCSHCTEGQVILTRAMIKKFQSSV